MSNKSIIIDNETIIKSTINIFSFSNLQSKTKLIISPSNSFQIKFCTQNTLIDNQNKNNLNKEKKSLIEMKNTSILRSLNFDIPSSEKLLDKNFQNKFMYEYDTSFAKFCGLNKSQFTDIFINNQYKPMFNEFGELFIPIKSIVKLLKTYSSFIKMKFTRRVLQKYKMNKTIKIKKINKNDEIKNNIPNINNNNNEGEEDKKNFININENSNLLNKEIDINKISNNNTFLNLKKKLKISIQNESFAEQYNIKKNNDFNNLINNEKNDASFPINPNILLSHLNNSSSNPFKSSSNCLQNINIDFLNKKRVYTPILYNNLNYYNNNLNNNNYNMIPFPNNNIFSPVPFKTSPFMCDLSVSSSNLNSPNISFFSPLYSNNNSYNIDHFIFNNNKNNIYINRPYIINNNVNEINNNIIYFNSKNEHKKETIIDENNLSNKTINSKIIDNKIDENNNNNNEYLNNHINIKKN